MLRTLFCCAVIFSGGCVYAQQARSSLKQPMFRDLKVTNSITKSLQDTVFTFHVETVADRDDQPDLSREYYWFHQGEVRKTQGGYTGKLLHGPFEKFDRNGYLFVKGAFDHGLKDGVWLTWHSNGNIARQYNWKNGYQIGKFVEYYPSGAMLRSGKFKHDKLHGTVSYYAQDGTITREEKYANGKIAKVKEKKCRLRRNKKEGTGKGQEPAVPQGQPNAGVPAVNDPNQKTKSRKELRQEKKAALPGDSATREKKGLFKKKNKTAAPPANTGPANGNPPANQPASTVPLNQPGVDQVPPSLPVYDPAGNINIPKKEKKSRKKKEKNTTGGSDPAAQINKQ